MTNDSINITIHSPDLIWALKQLVETLSETAMQGTMQATILAVPQTAAPTEDPVSLQKADTPSTDISVPVLPKIAFEEVHAALVKLKTQKSSAQVREILESVGCKTVQDIPADKFAAVLQMAAEKLGV